MKTTELQALIIDDEPQVRSFIGLVLSSEGWGVCEAESAERAFELLRALQEEEIRRVGSNRTQRVDVRVVTASNRDAEREVKEGRFRQDLFYRLNTVTLYLPPCASAAKTSCRSRATSPRASGLRTPRRPSRRSPSVCSNSIRGRATCASWRTHYSPLTIEN